MARTPYPESNDEGRQGMDSSAPETPDSAAEDELDPELVEAAIRAGEEAAKEDIAKDKTRLRNERDELSRELVSTQEEAIAARAEADEANARYQRLQADWDNYRKRTAQERLKERERAAEGVIEALLPAVDDLERAIEHARAAEGEAAEGLASGVAAVHAKILGVFAKEGVTVLDPLNEPFDPQTAQAVGTVEDAETYADTVMAVFRKGYALGDRIIRPAMVSVSVGGPRRPPEEP